MEKLIALGCDHAGFDYKSAVIELLQDKGFTVLDKGTNGTDSVDYPDFVHPVAQDVSNQKVSLGIVMCGSGNGVAMTVNKYADIRAALCWNKELLPWADNITMPTFWPFPFDLSINKQP